MGIDWMLKKHLVQAIPPAYAELLGRSALATLRVARTRAASRSARELAAETRAIPRTYANSD